ncbi:MAG: SpoIID/LytB domain-containing protein [Proteobacteria bacterium]|nr:SpoIID/LytB domain-containing protein [Pseudomonadota bacterium]
MKPLSLLPFLISLCLSLLAACAPIQKGATQIISNEPKVNVAILKGSKDVEISGSNLRLVTNRGAKTVGENKLLIINDTRGYRLGRKIYPASSIGLQGRDIKVNGRGYAGEIILIKENGTLTVINKIDMETYLYGVINNEISSAWPMEAVKAQAVAARTYAFYKLNSKLDKPYFLESTVMDQVYSGQGSEDERARRAVNETKGEILFHKKVVAQALFHSSCGGHTEAAENVWGTDYPYLKSVEDRFCTDAPNYFWTYLSSYDNISSALAAAGYPPGSSREIRVLERSESGRVVTVKIDTFTLSGEDLRRIIGYSRIKSTLFNIELHDDNVVFSGSGAGHGVGMCQWGAKGMAEAGHSYRDILHKYYNKVFLKKVY